MDLSLVVLGATELLKKGGVPSVWLPACAVLIAALLSAVVVINTPELIAQSLVDGALVGIAVTGSVGLVKGELNKRSLKK